MAVSAPAISLQMCGESAPTDELGTCVVSSPCLVPWEPQDIQFRDHIGSQEPAGGLTCGSSERARPACFQGQPLEEYNPSVGVGVEAGLTREHGGGVRWPQRASRGLRLPGHEL